MEEALQPLEAEEQVTSTNYFALGIAASVILHLICSVIIIGLPQGSSQKAAVTYIDLGLPQQAAPMTSPTPRVAPKAIPLPESPAVPEKALPPEPEQKPQPQPQEAKEVPPAATPQPAPAEEARSRTTLGLGLTKGYFKSLGEGESLRPGVKDYFLDMLQGINEKWWLDEKLDKRRVDPLVVNIVIARNGEIIGSEIMMSSGNPRYDRAVLAALNAASPLPPLPASYQGEYFQAPLRLVPPLNLMAW